MKVNNLVKERIKLEEYKLKEDFPLKLVEILEEMFANRDLPYNIFLLQSIYFKKLLSTTIKQRKECTSIADNISKGGKD